MSGSLEGLAEQQGLTPPEKDSDWPACGQGKALLKKIVPRTQ
jgi:hypothetical protein